MINIPYIGKIDPEKLEDYYEEEIEFGEGTIEIDVNFENETIDAAKLAGVTKILENLDQYAAKNKELIEKDYQERDEDDLESVRFYLNHHLEEADEETLLKLIDLKNETISREKQLLAKLHLVRVGFYPELEEEYVVFDYSIGRDFTDYLLVIKRDSRGELCSIEMES